MPLAEGKSDEARSANIAELIRSGKPRDQAAAIAYAKQRDAKDSSPRPAAGVMFVTADGSVLLMRRKGSDHAGEWSIPAGRAEGDETPLQTAEREAHEETGRKPNGKMRHVHSTTAGAEFHTFMEPSGEFQATVTDEHDGAGWFPMNALPSPLHPGLRETLGRDMDPGEWESFRASMNKWLDEETEEAEHRDAQAFDEIALDRASARAYDKDGHLVVNRTPLTKANVCEYYGREIPDAERLGLDPTRRYKLLRHPDEIKKAAASWNGKPLLISHKPVNAGDHPRDLVVGSVGTSAEWAEPYLFNSLSVWDKDAIDAIEGGRQRELSSAYHYTADMTPGTWEGQAYDGVMRDLHANHVALVRDGRAGSDVVVQDEVPAFAWSFGAFDAKFEEGKHPRGKGGKFARQAAKFKDPAERAAYEKDVAESAHTMGQGHEEVYYSHISDARQARSDKERDAHHKAAGEHEDAAAQYYEAHHHYQSGRTDEGHAAHEAAERQGEIAQNATERAEKTENAENERLKKRTEREEQRSKRNAEKRAAASTKRREAKAKWVKTGYGSMRVLPRAQDETIGAFEMSKPAFAFDAFEEGKHPRDHGKFAAAATKHSDAAEKTKRVHTPTSRAAFAATNKAAGKPSVENHRDAGAKHHAAHLENKHDPRLSGEHLSASEAHMNAANALIEPAAEHPIEKHLKRTKAFDSASFGPFALDGKFEESKHPRNKTGQFGAGAGTHKEYASHHDTMAKGLRGHIQITKGMAPETAAMKESAAKEHESAREAHKKADRSGIVGGSLSYEAYEASKKAHGATQAAAEHESLRSYGAGSGKTHKEHDAYHAAEAEKHEKALEESPDSANAGQHMEAAGAHHTASHRHRIAERHGPEHAEQAYRASKAAHEASQRANEKK